MNEFVYLYRGGTRPTSQEEGQLIMQKWMTWLKDLGEKGHVKDNGQPLEPTGKVVGTGKVITDGPYAESKDLIGGYTLILATDISEAADLSVGCPILERGGVVEIRPVMKMGM